MAEQRQTAPEPRRRLAAARVGRDFRGRMDADRRSRVSHRYTFTGSAAKPRTLIEWTRTAPAGSIS